MSPWHEALSRHQLLNSWDSHLKPRPKMSKVQRPPLGWRHHHFESQGKKAFSRHQLEWQMNSPCRPIEKEPIMLEDPPLPNPPPFSTSRIGGRVGYSNPSDDDRNDGCGSRDIDSMIRNGCLTIASNVTNLLLSELLPSTFLCCKQHGHHHLHHHNQKILVYSILESSGKPLYMPSLTMTITTIDVSKRIPGTHVATNRICMLEN